MAANHINPNNKSGISVKVLTLVVPLRLWNINVVELHMAIPGQLSRSAAGCQADSKAIFGLPWINVYLPVLSCGGKEMERYRVHGYR